MNETEFVKQLCDASIYKLEYDGFTISIGENLLYNVIVNEDLEYEPSSPISPKRGALAFQTDILVSKGKLPLVVVEAKYNSLTTHDILVYSNKAMKHKEIYPHLRYGLVVGGFSSLPVRFFTHNQGFDFAMTLKEINDTKVIKFTDLLLEQANDSFNILDLLKRRTKTSLYNSRMVLD